MNARQWQQSREVVNLLAERVGMTDAAIAAELGVTQAELKPVIGMLLGQGKIERCGFEYLVLASAQDTGGAA